MKTAPILTWSEAREYNGRAYRTSLAALCPNAQGWQLWRVKAFAYQPDKTKAAACLLVSQGNEALAKVRSVLTRKAAGENGLLDVYAGRSYVACIDHGDKVWEGYRSKWTIGLVTVLIGRDLTTAPDYLVAPLKLSLDQGSKRVNATVIIDRTPNPAYLGPDRHKRADQASYSPMLGPVTVTGRPSLIPARDHQIDDHDIVGRLTLEATASKQIQATAKRLQITVFRQRAAAMVLTARPSLLSTVSESIPPISLVD